MGTDYDAVTVIGYLVFPEGFLKPLLRRCKEVSHREDRFDPKTGKKIAQVKVVDTPDGWELAFNGKSWEGPTDPDGDYGWDDFVADGDMMTEIGAALGCSVTFNYSESGNFIAIEPLTLLPEHHGGYDLKKVARCQKEIVRIGRAAKKLGFEVDEPGIYSVVQSG